MSAPLPVRFTDEPLEELLDALQRCAGVADTNRAQELREEIRMRVGELCEHARHETNGRTDPEGVIEAEEPFQAVAENIPQLAWMTDATGNVVWFNRRWVEYTGLTLEDMREKGWSYVHHPDHPYSIVERWNETVRRGERWEDTFRLRGKNGEFRWFLSRAFPIRGPDGQITRYFGTNTDITELREMQDALRRAHEDLQRHAQQLEGVVAERTAKLRETIDELEAFSYSLSHDMRSPLQAIIGFCQIVEDDYAGELGENGCMLILRIRTAARRLDQLINDVLEYSRVTRESVQLHAVDVAAVVRQLVEENPALQPPTARITVEAPTLPVLGDDASLTQVIANLISNAVKFVAPGVAPEVTIRTELAPGGVQLIVADNGVGFPPDVRDRMFGMFQRFHAEKRYQGTGIGLAIVRKAVERMGGLIRVESTPGKGSQFIITLRAP